jgi:hypothetical protein
VLTGGAIDTQSSSLGRWSRPTVALCSVLFVVVATGAQLLRQSGVDMWRTVWAEDGVVFYGEALERPLREILFEPYAGYGLVVPRMLAAIGVHLPVEWYSTYAALSASLVASLFALFVYFASAPLLRSRVRQGILAVALLFWPVMPFEVTGAITNIQWVMIVGCLLAVLVPVDAPGAIATRVAVVVLAPLTSPLCVFFVPVAVWQVVVAIRSGSVPTRLVVPGAYLLAAATQVLIWSRAEQAVRPSPDAGSFVVDAAKLYSTKVTTEFFLGSRVTDEIWPDLGYWLAALSLLAMAGLLGWRWVRSGAVTRWFIAACVAASVVLYAVSLWQRPNFIDSMVIPAAGPYNFLGMRYQLFPAALLLLALLVRTDLSADVFRHPERRPMPAPRDDVREHRVLLVAVAVWVAVAFVPSFRLTTLRSNGPDWVTEVSDAEQACRSEPGGTRPVPISPPPEWVVPIPCSVLVDGE